MNEALFFEKAYRLINLFNAKNKKPHEYATGHSLYPSEVHIIEVIGDNQALTATEISKIMAVTKGAVSQTTSKLIQKDLIGKRLADDGSNTILLYLKEDGEKIYKEHRERHKKMLSAISELTAQITPETEKLLSDIFCAIEENLENI